MICIYGQEKKIYPHYCYAIQKGQNKFSQCMELIDPIVNPDIIVTLERNLDEVDLKIIP